MMVDKADNILLYFAAQDPLDHFHGLGIGNTHALDEFAFFTNFCQRLVNLRAAAMHHHRVHANQFEQNNIARKGFLQGRLCHGIAAILDDNGLAMKTAYEW